MDFYSADANLVIEVDGPVHEYTPAEDAIRQEYLESLGLRVLRYTNDTVFSALDDVVRQVREAITPRR